MPQVSAESLFDKIKRKADEIIAEQEAKADQKIDQTIDETVDSAEQAVYEGHNDGSNTSSGAGAGNSASTKPPAATGDNANAMLVKMTQTELKRLGYSVSVDGVYGSGTRNAILTYEADSGRQLTGNVSPELVNALKGTSKSGSTGKSTTKTTQTASQVAVGETSKREKAQKLLSECQAKADNSGVFFYCLNTCNQVLSAPSEAVGTYLYQCEASHKAAFQQAAKIANASANPSQAVTNTASAGSYDKAEAYIQQMRKLAAECQAVSGNKSDNAARCATVCNKFAQQTEMFPEQAIQFGESRLELCREKHQLVMGS
jgi:peptidoglycan hydrolase-like protein with peptidoglycan-binding domain